jgi:aminoglycoside phosphotransferase (APT) family kinase protein
MTPTKASSHPERSANFDSLRSLSTGSGARSKEPWIADIAIDADIAGAAITAQFPALSGLNVRPFGEGWDNAAFLVGERFVFRFPRRRIAVELIETEMRTLPALAPRLPLPVPLPRFAGKPGAAFDWPFAGYERIPGRALSEIVLPERACEQLAVACGTFLRRLHALEPASLPALRGDTIGRMNHEHCMPRLRQRLQELDAAGLLDDPRAMEPLLDVLEDIRPDGVRADRACVVHGDLYSRHILVGDDYQAAGIIDWGDVHRGDPAVDLSIAFSLFPPGPRAAFAAAYGAIDARTWELARYRAIYSCVLGAQYAYRIGDRGFVRAALAGLSNCRT